jgi:hypothetical protein
MKSFGRDRTYTGENPPAFYQVAGASPKKQRVAVEPQKHGEFARFEEGTRHRASNIAFWRKKYWQPEGQRNAVLTESKKPRQQEMPIEQRRN